MRRFEAEALSGAMVKAIHGMSDVLLGDGIKATFLWEELSDQSVHVLVGTTLPGSVRMREEEVSAERPGNPLSVVSVWTQSAKGVSKEITASDTA